MNKKALKIIGIICVVAFLLRFSSGIIMGLFQMKPTPMVSYTYVQNTNYMPNIKLSGRVVSVHSAEVKARVEGLLEKKYFQEGTFVKKGQKLFQLDPKGLSIEVRKAEASVANAKASLIELEKNMQRIKQLIAEDFISHSEYDKALANRDMARANLSAARAQLADARLNLSYASIQAPVSGRISNLSVTEGNIIEPLKTSLATIVSIDPIYVTFDISAKDYLMLKKAITTNQAIITLKLPDGTTYPEQGKLDFYNNQIDEMTGTIKLRATFSNPDNILVPGEFIETSISFGSPQKVYTLPQNLVLQNSNGKYVYILNKENQTEIRSIEVGEAIDSNWVISKGLCREDRVISDNIQNLRPGMKVKVKE